MNKEGCSNRGILLCSLYMRLKTEMDSFLAFIPALTSVLGCLCYA